MCDTESDPHWGWLGVACETTLFSGLLSLVPRPSSKEERRVRVRVRVRVSPLSSSSVEGGSGDETKVYYERLRSDCQIWSTFKI